MLANNVQRLDHRLDQVFNELQRFRPKMIDALTKLAREIRESLKYMIEFKGTVHKDKTQLLSHRCKLFKRC